MAGSSFMAAGVSSSGSEHCDWTFLGGVVDRGDSHGSFLEADFRTFLLPRKDYEIVDTWRVVGLKGTGSQDVVVARMSSSMARSCPSTAPMR